MEPPRRVCLPGFAMLLMQLAAGAAKVNHNESHLNKLSECFGPASGSGAADPAACKQAHLGIHPEEALLKQQQCHHVANCCATLTACCSTQRARLKAILGLQSTFLATSFQRCAASSAILPLARVRSDYQPLQCQNGSCPQCSYAACSG
eukprot:4162404-Prymnesium_polylepis.2